MAGNDQEGVPVAIDTPEDLVAFNDVSDDLNVQDETENELHASRRFTITSYGADLSVFDLRRRLGKELLIPAPFQRKYVWTQRQASRFIESILMGLPVPGIFVYLKDKKQLIVDGQQRLITLDRFLSGVWERRQRRAGNQIAEVIIPFELSDVAEPWAGKVFDALDQDDRDQIENYLIHTTSFRQDAPVERDRSIYEVFERINTGGLRLSAQEIRTCVSHGRFIELLDHLVEFGTWKEVYGKRSPRMKDEELILRFFAFLDRRAAYSRPMAEFLDKFLEDKKDISDQEAVALTLRFQATLDTLKAAVGEQLFRPESALNAAVFDSVMTAVAVRLGHGPIQDLAAVGAAYATLLGDQRFQDLYRRATADDENVKQRMALAIQAFSGVA